MSAHRDLLNAQQALNEAVAAWVADWDTWHPDRHPAGATGPIYEAHLALVEQQSRLDAPGGAAPRPTSINAAHANLPAKETLRRRIIFSVVANMEQFHTGMTVSELKGRLRKEHSSVSSAINSLMMHGWLKDSGETRLTQHGQPAIVWVATDMAIGKVRDAALEVADDQG